MVYQKRLLINYPAGCQRYLLINLGQFVVCGNERLYIHQIKIKTKEWFIVADVPLRRAIAVYREQHCCFKSIKPILVKGVHICFVTHTLMGSTSIISLFLCRYMSIPKNRSWRTCHKTCIFCGGFFAKYFRRLQTNNTSLWRRPTKRFYDVQHLFKIMHNFIYLKY